ncbi:CNPV224 hypothetical protein [Canarypox virus]|uniref:SWPV2-ORF212 n=2 Tax=Canarypox virus TaxID=44088 RepID=A0A1V0QGJ2_CNPV|nr:CNPV224 hypothetical protein [Canarypox virus]ARE67456.1 SWPV2-ORF212 [Shearwaterpox virus]QRI42944.1 hypothetical protein ChPV226 [Cheloniid poxvirus 1]QRM15504.1 hypothetical protein [Mudlarkpox virus]QRM15859.1 hypothetical protein [Penguinpox virus 2]QRM16195.1 hypothetical protein [Albatrosspox virus]
MRSYSILIIICIIIYTYCLLSEESIELTKTSTRISENRYNESIDCSNQSTGILWIGIHNTSKTDLVNITCVACVNTTSYSFGWYKVNKSDPIPDPIYDTDKDPKSIGGYRYGYPAYLYKYRDNNEIRPRTLTNVTFVNKCKRNTTECVSVQGTLEKVKEILERINNTDYEYDLEEVIEEDYEDDPEDEDVYVDQHDNQMHTVSHYLLIKNSTLLNHNYTCMLIAGYYMESDYLVPLDII